MANLINEGLINIHKEFADLEDNWDGYTSLPIHLKILDSVKDMSFVSYIISLFKKVDFKESDINICPMSNGNIQYEAENKNVYLSIEIDTEYYENWLKNNGG